jgi:nucleoside-diphosphate-sugar epimerase
LASSVLLTGASGYIGRNFLNRLRQCGIAAETIGDTRSSAQEDIGSAVEGPILIHLAGASGRESVDAADRERAHRMSNRAIELLRERGGRSAILVSSIYATLAEDGRGGAYGAHKLEIERLFSANLGPGLVILRLPPIYGGDGDHGSVRRLANLVGSGIPLPLGRANAPRDYLAMSNLLDLFLALIAKIEDHPAEGKARVYEPCDGKPISTVELTRQLAGVLGVRTRLLPIPEPVVRWILRVAGRAGLGEGAFSPLLATGNARLQTALDWQPGISMPESLAYLTAKPT